MLMSRHRAATTAAAAAATAAAAAAAAAATAATAAAGLSFRWPRCGEDMHEEVSEHGVAGYLPRQTWLAG